ncbi:MAG: hypothetical protein CM15mP83_4840 [Flavobacteriaceae bacterium]|nr:MAG: hypothetical protein CM15mP83_4840 [Flavobacteriaceae bacterium]
MGTIGSGIGLLIGFFFWANGLVLAFLGALAGEFKPQKFGLKKAVRAAFGSLVDFSREK